MQFRIITNNGVENYKSIECYDSLDDSKLECFADGLSEGVEKTEFGNNDKYDFVILRDFLEHELFVITKEDWKKIQIKSRQIYLINNDDSGFWEDHTSQEELEDAYQFG